MLVSQRKYAIFCVFLNIQYVNQKGFSKTKGREIPSTCRWPWGEQSVLLFLNTSDYMDTLQTVLPSFSLNLEQARTHTLLTTRPNICKYLPGWNVKKNVDYWTWVSSKRASHCVQMKSYIIINPQAALSSTNERWTKQTSGWVMSKRRPAAHHDERVSFTLL